MSGNTSDVSVIGLGQLGERLAQAFLSAGHRTTVWNRTPAKTNALAAQGAAPAGSVDAAVAASPLVVVCLPNYEIVQTLLEPVADRLPGRVLANLSSGTPEAAERMGGWAAAHGADYLDGAAMSGTRLVGHPEGLFLFSGAPEAFQAHRPVLAALGNAVHLGADPGLASLYDTALFGLAWGALAGFYHAVALIGAQGVDPTAFAAVATGHMPFVTSLMAEHAGQIRDGHYPPDDGTVDVHAAAMEHLVQASEAHGVRTDLPELVKSLLDQTAKAGRGGDGIAGVSETISMGGRHA